MNSDLSRFSDEQQAVIHTWGQGMAVLAGAGAGKTTTLVAKCHELVRRSESARFAAVSFTERSASDLREKLSRNLSLDSHWVTTIHGLCGAIVREYPREAGFDGSERVADETEAGALWEQAVSALWFRDLEPGIAFALESLLERESQSSLLLLLARVRSLRSFGVLDRMEGAEPLRLVAEYVLNQYQRLKRRSGVMDFGDLEIGASAALENARVRAYFHRRFDLVLVDEFQDTNVLQASILSRFAREDRSNICVVGDPKQSIYRFRDADVSVFDEFRQKMPVQLSLTANFRSRPGILDFVNSVCLPAFRASGQEYTSLRATRPEEESGGSVVRLDVSDPFELAAWLKEQVANGQPLGGFALLLRKIRGNERWLRALSAAGIPLAIGSGGLFWEDPRVRELVAFLKWWSNPANTLSGAVFLRAPWVALDDRTLDEWIRRGQPQNGLRGLFLASDHPLAKVLSRAEGMPLRPGELLLRLLELPQVERELGMALLTLWHRCEEWSAKGFGFSRVVAELTAAVEEERRERDVPPPQSEGQLRVLTLHGSKGLEFDHVILVDFSGPTRASPAPLLFWDRKQGAYLADRDESGARARSDSREKEWRELERAKDLAESQRLFYVALTRAKERLVLVFPPRRKPETEAEASSDADAGYLRDDWRGWIERGPSLPRVLVSQAGIPAAILAPPGEPSTPEARTSTDPNLKKFRLRRARHSVTEWSRLHQCERSYFFQFIDTETSGRSLSAEEKRFPGRHDPQFRAKTNPGLSAREIGTRVHRCLESMDEDGLRAIEDEAGSERFSAAAVLRWARTSHLMRPSSVQTVWTELAFEVPVGDEILVGAIDRLIETRSDSGARRFDLVDFKITQSLKAADEVEGFVKTYSTQLKLYAYALHCLEGAHPIQAVLVNITPEGVQGVPFDLGKNSSDEIREHALGFAQRADAIINSAPHGATPGDFCRFCEHVSRCDEGRAFLRR